MALDQTSRMANVKDSIKKFLIDNLYTVEGVQLMFDTSQAVPKIQGHNIDRWIRISFGETTNDYLSSMVLRFYCSTREDAEGFKLAQLRDKLVGYLFDDTMPDNMRRITLYRSRATGAWTNIGNLCVVDVSESEDLKAPDETKYRIVTAIIKWSSK